MFQLRIYNKDSELIVSKNYYTACEICDAINKAIAYYKGQNTTIEMWFKDGMIIRKNSE